jgi:hypothetical protein
MTRITGIKRLSPRKVCVSCDMDIRTPMSSEARAEDCHIGSIPHSIVYKKIEDGSYYPVLKDSFIAKICGKWGIRKKYVYFNRNKEQDISLDGELVTLFSMDVIFDNPEWHKKWKRDSYLSDLLDNKNF